MITYVDTSVVLKLLVDDEVGGDAAQRLWLESEFVVCAEIGYAEARAAFGAMRRNGRLTPAALRSVKAGFEELWAQVGMVVASRTLIRSAGDLAEQDHLRGYDAVHLAAGLAAKVDVFASADDRLLAAAASHRLATANPLTPRS